jgi:serine protease Do
VIDGQLLFVVRSMPKGAIVMEMSEHRDYGSGIRVGDGNGVSERRRRPALVLLPGSARRSRTSIDLAGIRKCLVAVTVLMISPLLLSATVYAQSPAKKGPVVDLASAIVQVAKQNIPAVVHIDVIERQEVSGPSFPFEGDPLFRYFFGEPRGPKKYQRELHGLGTGMIIDANGNILTNHHVAGGATKIEVSLSDGRKYPGKLVGSDSKTDLAVVRITAKESFPYVRFGDSDRMEVGEWVIAIGHPRGLDQTVTQGIISAKHRRGITDPTSYQDFLQTDAAINPGNSGGPLLNLYGEVIGVNTAIASQSGGSEGIGFAIPSNMAIHVAKRIIASGKVERGWLGLSVRDLTPDIAKTLRADINRGAVVSEVVKGGPAERGGLKKNDVVVSFQGREIIDGAELRNLAAIAPIGQDARLTVVRDGKKQEMVVRIGSLQEAAKFAAGMTKDRLGIEVRAVTAKEAGRFGIDSKQGVAITWVDPKGPLGLVGFEVGDIVLAINGQAITGLDTFLELTASLRPRQRATLDALDSRTGNTGSVQVVLR